MDCANALDLSSGTTWLRDCICLHVLTHSLKECINLGRYQPSYAPFRLICRPSTQKLTDVEAVASICKIGHCKAYESNSAPS